MGVPTHPQHRIETAVTAYSAVNRGKLHPPKFHRSNRPLQLTQEDVHHLLKLKSAQGAKDGDWIFRKERNSGPICHEQVLGKKTHPVSRNLGLPHIAWRLRRHWGTTQMPEENVPIKAAQQRLGHTRSDILLKHYTHVLDESAECAAEALGSPLSGNKTKLKTAKPANSKTPPSIGSQTAASNRKGVM